MSTNKHQLIALSRVNNQCDILLHDIIIIKHFLSLLMIIVTRCIYLTVFYCVLEYNVYLNK